MFTINGNDLRTYWGSGETIEIENKKYSVHRMSYGDYFLEQFGKERGEREGFSSDTLWLKKIDIKRDIYGIAS